MLSRPCVIPKVGRDHSAVAWHTLLAGRSPPVAADTTSAGGGLRGQLDRPGVL